MAIRSDVSAYFPVQPADLIGVEVTTAGYQHLDPGSPYPPPGHPASHGFEWAEGRILDEHHLVLIMMGSGEFETSSGEWQADAGDVLVIRKGDWHRYRPDTKVGWEVYWLGYKTNAAVHIDDALVGSGSRVLHDAGNQEAACLFDQLFAIDRLDAKHLAMFCAGTLLQIIALLTSSEAGTEGTETRTVSSRAKQTILSCLPGPVDHQKIATRLNVSYSRYRSLFKQQTGRSPHQFVIEQRLACAIRLLANSSLGIESVAHRSGFDSPSYFSRLFHKRFGRSPSTYRYGARAAGDHASGQGD